MKIAKQAGRVARLAGIGLAVVAIWGPRPASAQQEIDSRFRVPPAPPRDPDAKPADRGKTVDLRSSFNDVPAMQPKRLPVSPNDAIAIVNKQAITRQQLADECIATAGKKVLDTMINRLLIEQALASRKLEVTAAEIDQEIDGIAARFGFSREVWLRALDKERNISPAQYAREIVYPAIALRKLCSDRVQVTPKDMKDAFESMYGEKLKVRMILVNNQHKALAIWEQLHSNPGGFEKVAEDQSMDPSTKAQGGLVLQPITRHANPKTVSDAAFRQLVDGDPSDKDPTHKPKDGDISGPIQMDEAAWIILKREELIPANKDANPKDERIMKQTYDMIHEVKLKEAMEKFYEEVIKQAEIENRLTGGVKLANEDIHPEYRVDGDVKLMGRKGAADGSATRADGQPAAPSARSPKLPRPAALSPEVAAQQFRPLKPGGDPAPKGGAQAPAPTKKPAAPTAAPAGGQ